jgi:hypothetical protein
LSKVGNLPWFRSLDISVDKVPHVGFVRFDVEGLTAGISNDTPHIQKMLQLLLNTANVYNIIARAFHFISNVGVSAHQGCSGFVERRTLRFPFLQVGRNFRVATEVMNVLQFILGSLNRLAQKSKGFDSVIETFFALLKPILQQDFRSRAAGAMVQRSRVPTIETVGASSKSSSPA